MKSSIDEELVKSFEGFVFELLKKKSYLKHYKGRHFDCHVDLNWRLERKKILNSKALKKHVGV